MAVTHGLDPLVVRQIAKAIADAGRGLYDIGDEADRAVRALVWEGNDCAKFKARWASVGLRAFHDVAGQLEQASKDLGAQVDQQDATSNHGPSPSGGPGLPNPLDILGGLFGGDDDGGGLGGFLGDLAGGLWEGISDVGEALGDGAEWVGDRLEDGAEWVGDRVEDGLSVAGHVFNWVGDRVTDGLGWAADAAEWGTDLLGSAVSGAGDLIGGALDWAGLDGAAGFVRGGLNHLGGGIESFGDALPRTVDSLSTLVHAIGDPLSEGRMPAISEVAAAGLLVAGNVAGARANFFTGQDQHWFDDGAPTVGSPEPVSGTFHAPTDLNSLISGVADADNARPDGQGNVRITTVTQSDGSQAYVVSVPGTSDWGPGTGGQSPIDLTGNLVAMTGQQSTAMEGVSEAMSVIPPGAPVMLVGHSQGGIIASQLVSDPAFMDRYNVTNMMTYGSPIDTATIPPGVDTLALAHYGDIVPRLDLGGASPYSHGFDLSPAGSNVQTVYLENAGTGLDYLNPFAQHGGATYQESITTASGDQLAALNAYESSISEFMVNDGGAATAVDVSIGRSVEED